MPENKMNEKLDENTTITTFAQFYAQAQAHLSLANVSHIVIIGALLVMILVSITGLQYIYQIQKQQAQIYAQQEKILEIFAEKEANLKTDFTVFDANTDNTFYVLRPPN